MLRNAKTSQNSIRIYLLRYFTHKYAQLRSYMKLTRLVIITICCGLVALAVQAQPNPKREFRAAWLATYANIDWPSSRNLTPAQEQAEFIQRVTEYKTNGMNAIFVQVRSQCDAMYPSPFDPWSADLTGTQGVAPSPFYDPLQFMIDESHKRGLEFHAWFNPYRALATATTSSLAALSPNHIVNTQPGWILDCTTNSNGAVQKILNPGLPEVWNYVIGVVMHVVRNYDVDGIHFDDYFYTNPALTTYNDDATYNQYSRGIGNKNDWRRSNVDTLIKRLGDSIRAVKPWVKFGISPTGIWMSQANNPLGSNTSSGATQHFRDLFANSRLWQQNGWIDYLAPQVYWFMGQTGSDYNNLIPWWNNNAFSRHMYIGQAGYKVGDPAQGSFNTDNGQIPKQVRLNRTFNNIHGQIVYNTTSLRNNRLGFRDSLRQNLYNTPALWPVMSWIDNTPPPAPTQVTATLTTPTQVTLTWQAATTGSELARARQFAIYRATDNGVNINNVAHFIGITPMDTLRFVDNIIADEPYYYIVTALDRMHNESAPSAIIAVNTGLLPLTLQHFSVAKKGNTAQLLWLSQQEINFSHFVIERSANGSYFEPIAQVKAQGSQQSTNTYRYEDNLTVNAARTWYYRLKMVDADGKYQYSPVRTIKDVTATVAVYPNPVPVHGTLIVQLPASDSKVQYRLVNAQGIAIQQGTLAPYAQAAIRLQAQVKAGSYWLQLQSGDGNVHTAILQVQ